MWYYDFVHDALVNGKSFRGLLVNDEASDYALAIYIARSFNATDVKATLLHSFRRFGVARHLRSGNGRAFMAEALNEWLVERGTETICIDPGKRWQIGPSESTNGTYRNEFLDAELFYNIGEARIVSGSWRGPSNQRRPHSSNNYRPPNTAYHFNSGKRKAS